MNNLMEITEKERLGARTLQHACTLSPLVTETAD
jgi:hypothetical protein